MTAVQFTLRSTLLHATGMLKLMLIFLVATVSGTSVCAQAINDAPYRWKNVQIIGGGFVDGTVFHPTAGDVRYARTDIGGAYRWDGSTHRWQQMLDWVSYSDRNLMGIESIAIDPADPDRVYLACGTYTNPRTPNGAILRSRDRGKTFARTDVSFKFGGNEDGRGNGERLTVDPADSRILYLGTRHDGLWRSEDYGTTWNPVLSFPKITRQGSSGIGIVFVTFVPAANAGSRSHQKIYVGASLTNQTNLYTSSDDGKSWQEVPGGPTQYGPTRSALSSDGFLYIAYGSSPGPSRMKDGAVWKLNVRTGVWAAITPEHPVSATREFGYAAVSVDAKHPQWLIASSFGRPHAAGGDDLFRSTNSGATWRPIFGGGGVYDYSLAPYVKSTPIHWLFDVEIDPSNPDHALFTTGYGGWETFDLTASDRAKPTHWSIMASGIEETVALQLDSPSRGAFLNSAMGDYGGFVHRDLDRPAPEGFSSPPHFGNNTGVASATLHPEMVVRVGENAERKPQSIGYSLDGGGTWKLPPTMPSPESRGGSIAVAADGSTWVWTPEHAAAYITKNSGATWTASRGVPESTRITADPINPGFFYALSLAEKKLYFSTDGAATFTASDLALSDGPLPDTHYPRGDERGGQDRLYAAPAHQGDLWLAAATGLYHADESIQNRKDASTSFTRLAHIDEIHAFGFGKAAPQARYPAMYLVGTIQQKAGIFRSIDEGRNWSRINDDQHQWGLILQIAGDPKLYGRVYVGTHGRGILYGDPK